MKITAHIITSSNTFDVTVDVDYYVPQVGDTLLISGNPILITEPMRPRVEIEWDEGKKEYIGRPMVTTEGTDRIVFHTQGYTWRKGESFTKGEKISKSLEFIKTRLLTAEEAKAFIMKLDKVDKLFHFDDPVNEIINGY